jgi:aspartyl-tRNA(Asn)/glutamyl-tRNA(Gln) amidotransferase subunit A
MTSAADLPESIEGLAAAWGDSDRRPSTLIAQLSEAASHGNAKDRIYTAILADRSRLQARRLDEACEPGAIRSPRAPLPVEAPLFGVPVAVKDNIDIGGVPTSCGSRALARPAAARDAAIVRQLERLGAIVLGKTNLDEAALGASGRNEHFGRCINPRGADWLSGGSSGGSAAAVAKRQVLLAVGTDTLGSVRIPAALCGIVGFKPSPEVISSQGVAPLYPAFDTVGLMAGSLPDIELASIALGIGARPWRPIPADPRIMLLDASALAEIDAGVAADYRRCCDLLRRSTALRLSEFPPLDFVALSRAALWEVASDFAARIGFLEPRFAAQRERLGHELARLLERASTLPPAKLDAGRAHLRQARQRIMSALADVDGLLTPTCSVAAIGAAAELPRALSAFVVPANVAGLPAICWPQALAGGSTTSLQLIGHVGCDRQLIGLAGSIQNLLGRSRGQRAGGASGGH